jgi:hypothetical protein
LGGFFVTVGGKENVFRASIASNYGPMIFFNNLRWVGFAPQPDKA